MNLAVLQHKVANGMVISAAEEAFMIKAANDRGIQSRRRATGWEEYPDSVIDLEGLDQAP